MYLDTSFYRWLARADELTAREAIARLDALRVRPVISEALIEELLRVGDRRRDDVLHARLSRFARAPYATLPGLAWSLLVAGAPVRGEVPQGRGRVVTSWAPAARVAGSVAAMTRQGVPTKDEPRFWRDNRELFEAIGIVNPQGATRIPWKMIGRVASRLDVNLPLREEPPARDELRSFAVRLTEQLQAREAVPDAVLGDDGLDRSGPTVRGSEHLGHFLAHRNRIDFLQVDRAQWSELRERSPRHRLAELGLANRCFTAGSLAEVVAAVRRRVQARPSGQRVA